MLRAALLVGVGVVVAAPSPADACIPIGNRPHVVDPAHSGDTVAPAAVRITGSFALVANGGTCNQVGRLTIAVRASDDVTPEDKLGYEVRVVNGSDLVGGGPRTLLNDDGALHLSFNGAIDGFSIDVEIAAVDLNGNVGPFTAQHFDWVNPNPPEDEDGGCTTSSGAGWLTVLGLAGVISLVRRRRRR